MRLWFYGDRDGINTDMLFPGKYTYTCATPDEIRPHLLEDLDPEFTKQVTPGDVIFAGKNFGCGSSREQPVLGLKAVGIAAVVAKGFARIFYRAAINQGLLLIESPRAVEACRPDSSVRIDAEKGVIIVDGQSFTFPTLPEEIKKISRAGGLLAYTRNLLETKGLGKS